MPKTVRRLLVTLCVGVVVFAVVVTGLIVLGGPVRPPVHAQLAAGDEVIESSLDDRPELERFQARDGAMLSYRRYQGAAGGGVVVLVHGSSGSSSAVHQLGQAFAAAGITALAPDIRGHGQSGTIGDIAYVGQLDDDMADLVSLLDRIAPDERRLLIGHSSGGGFVLRIAGGPVACRFDGFVALSPYLQHSSPSNRAGAGWASAGVARIVGLSIIGRFGLHAFDGLPTLAFAIPADTPRRTPSYSWRLMSNFGLDLSRWKQTIEAIQQPTRVIIGADDELFHADMYPETFAALKPDIAVSIVADVDHMGMVLDPVAIQETVSAASMMLADAGSVRCR